MRLGKFVFERAVGLSICHSYRRDAPLCSTCALTLQLLLNLHSLYECRFLFGISLNVSDHLTHCLDLDNAKPMCKGPAFVLHMPNLKGLSALLLEKLDMILDRFRWA